MRRLGEPSFARPDGRDPVPPLIERQRHRHMFVDRLALVVVFGIELAIRTGDCLRSFVGFETQVAHLVLVGLLLVSKAVVAEHKIVVRLQVFRIDRQNGLQHVHGVRVFALEKQNASQIVQRHAIPGILRQNLAEMIGSFVVTAIAAQDFRIEKVSPRQVRTERQRFCQHSAGTIHVTFLHRGASDIHPAVGILGINLCHFLERRLRAFQITLQQQTNPVIVPALPVVCLQNGLWHGRRGGVRTLRSG